MPLPTLSIVIPAYNEAACIAQTINAVRAALDQVVPSWELIVADDGSTDGTPRIAREAAGADARIRVSEAPHGGKGAAVRRGMLEARGEWRFLADADLSMPIAEIVRFLPAPGTPAAEVVIGSREVAGARRIDEPWHRHAIGRVFTWFVKILVLTGIEDTQCGFKLFSGRAAEALFSRQRLDGFGFDVEVLYLARRAGLTIRQVPVTWTYDAQSKVTWWSGLDGFLDLLRVRWNAASGAYRGLDRDAISNGPPEGGPHTGDAAGPSTGADGGLPSGGDGPTRVWSVAAWIVGAIMAASVAVGVLRIPVQTTDSIVPILQAEETPSVVAAVKGSFNSTAFLRPLRIGQIQLLYELARDTGRYYLVFRGFHVALVVAAFALFVTALRVRTRDDFLVATFALTVLTGLHTFLGTVWEAYPINHFLEIAVCCLLALVLAQSRGGWWADLAAALTFLVASLTLESGLLVWVVVVAARLAGMRGVSQRGVIVVTALLAGYMYLRFGALGTGTPTLIERASGFWIERLETDELVRRFGERPGLFYAYNVVSSWSSVLFSEPRAGVFAIPLQILRGELMPGTLMNVWSSVATTLLIVLVVVRRWGEWLRRRFTPADQLVFVMFAVLLGNGAISYGYTKDETMSAAGVFYALAAFAGARGAVDWAAAKGRGVRMLLALLLTVTATAWVARTAGLHYHMQRIAHIARGEWVDVDRWLQEQDASPNTPGGRRIVETLRQDAIDRPVMNRYFLPEWAERWFQ
jgi:hypothetical protein